MREDSCWLADSGKDGRNFDVDVKAVWEDVVERKGWCSGSKEK